MPIFGHETDYPLGWRQKTTSLHIFFCPYYSLGNQDKDRNDGIQGRATSQETEGRG